jgi:hypothetical protein
MLFVAVSCQAMHCHSSWRHEIESLVCIEASSEIHRQQLGGSKGGRGHHYHHIITDSTPSPIMLGIDNYDRILRRSWRQMS